MPTKIAQIEGIGPTYAGSLAAAGVATLEQLLERASTPTQRAALADETAISERLLLEWANRADLARISGVGSEYADLLEHAGVDSVLELAQRNPENLLNKLTEINAARKFVRRMPSLKQLETWITEAKHLPRAVHH